MEDSLKNINVTIGYPSLLQATGQLMDDNKQLEVKSILEVFYRKRVRDSQRNLKVHHWLSLVIIGCA